MFFCHPGVKINGRPFFHRSVLQAKAGSMFDKVVASMGLTEYAKLVGPCLDTGFFLIFFMCQENMGLTWRLIRNV